jgi:hypothetical protein
MTSENKQNDSATRKELPRFGIPPAYMFFKWSKLKIKSLTRIPANKERVDCGFCIWDDENPMILGVHAAAHSPHVCTIPDGKICPRQNKFYFHSVYPRRGEL